MSWLWILVPAAVVVIWIVGRLRRNQNDLGSVSAQWLQDHRRETHQDR